MLFKIIVITVLVLIVASLFSALVFMYKDKGSNNKRTVQALTARIVLSIVLFLFLMAAFYFGFVPARQ